MEEKLLKTRMKKAIQKYKELQDIELETIYDFIDNGDRSKAPPEIIEYLELMDKIRGMSLRIDRYGGKDAIVNHLIKVEGLSRYLANKIYNQAMEYFYADEDLSRDAWLNRIIDKMEKSVSLAQMLVKDVSDQQKVHNMLKDLRDTVIIARPEKSELPQGAYDRPTKIYTLSMEDLGRVPQPKKELRDFIMNLPEVSEKVKQMALQEALLEPMQIFPDENEDPRKS